MRLTICALRLVGRIIISCHYGLTPQMLDGSLFVFLI